MTRRPLAVRTPLTRRCAAACALAWVVCGLAAAPAQAAPASAGSPATAATRPAEAPTGLQALRWLDDAGQPLAPTLVALRLLNDAGAEGLHPDDYRLAAVPADAEGRAAWERALSRTLLRYARDLHQGRVDPRPLGFRWDAQRPAFDAQAWLLAARPDLATAAAQLPPPVAPYAALRRALAAYRALPDQSTGPALPPLPRKLEPGGRWAGMAALRRQLRALGDLPADAAEPTDPQLYDAALSEAVRRFQQRHGLADDGIIGRSTEAALRVPPAQRVRQIEWSMERLRWLPPLDDPRGVAINIPTFRLQTWEGHAASATPGPAMGVIVGKALDTRTPVMVATLRHLIFRPYWNIPRSILLKEVIPAWLRDPAYLERHHMEIVRGPGDDAQVLGTGLEHVEALRAGALRLRQRPGPHNSLGRVKFVFPNDEAVYLHDTPAPLLFQRSRRDFSHGCVRVEDPAALAQWLLQGNPGWDRARVEAAMAGADNQRVELARPLPVVLYYLTAVVDPRDGRLHLADDLYGHDARLAAALARRP